MTDRPKTYGQSGTARGGAGFVLWEHEFRQHASSHGMATSQARSYEWGSDGGAVKGVVFNLLEELVRKEFGESEWHHVRQDADVDASFDSLTTYPDTVLRKLVAAVAKRAQKTPGEALQWFGRYSMPLLAQRYAPLFESQTSTRAFILTLNDIIHPEVLRRYPGADVPVFDFDTSVPDALTVGYQSPRKLCALATGFIEGAADHYGETVEVEQTTCMHRGDPKCVFQLRFSGHGP